MFKRTTTNPATLRVIPITKPGVPGVSLALVRTDAEEATVRANLAAEGLVAGKAMPTQPNPQFWSFIDHISGR